jgi:hypothetical protein
MTEHNQTPADADDTEGHLHLRPPEDTEGYQGTEDDTHGHVRTRNDDSDDDAEGHVAKFG